MRTRTRVFTGLAVTATGLAALVLAWALRRHAYSSGLLINLGTALLLVVPLLVFENLFAQRVEAAEGRTQEAVTGVREEVRAVSGQLEAEHQRLDELQRELADRLASAQEADQSLANAAREAPTFDAVWALLKRALELNAISQDGVRTVVPHLWERIRFTPVDADADQESRQIAVRIETADAEPLPISTAWTPSRTIVDVLSEIAERWKKQGEYPGDSAIDASEIVTSLISTVELAIEARSLRGDNQLDRVVELLSPTWVLTEGWLEHYPDYYPITGSDLATEAGLAEWRSHMREKVWVDEESAVAREQGRYDFWMVSEVARRYFERKEKAST